MPAEDGKTYELNLIDTPGHVDFSYEVSRSLAACEGAILVVDASQGIQAQTVSNLFLALDADLEIIPVLNKIDLPGAEPENAGTRLPICWVWTRRPILLASAKEGRGIGPILEAVVERIPAPVGDPEAPLRALIFDSYYDQYLGAVPSIRVVDGTLKAGMKVTFGNVDASYEVDEVGIPSSGQGAPAGAGAGAGRLPGGGNQGGVPHPGRGHHPGLLQIVRPELLPGYQDVHSMVFAGLYPTDADDYEDLRDALDRLILNDASLHFVPETSIALGFGFRCGFLGLLHMEIIQERLEREFGVNLITTVPNVEYHVNLTDGTELRVENPASLPPAGAEWSDISEPVVKARIVCPSEYIGNVQKLCHERRGVFGGMHYLDPKRVELDYELAPGRDRPGLLRPAQIGDQGLRRPGLRVPGVPACRSGEARHSGERGSGGRLQRHHPPGQGLRIRPDHGGEAERTHSQAAV